MFSMEELQGILLENKGLWYGWISRVSTPEEGSGITGSQNFYEKRRVWYGWIPTGFLRQKRGQVLLDPRVSTRREGSGMAGFPGFL